jgi:membrane protein YdbS with pleckstrin-like domain
VARLLLADGEDLLAQFRPHPASRLVAFLSGLLYAGYGLAGWWLGRTLGWEGWAWVAVLLGCVVHAWAAHRFRAAGVAAGVVGALGSGAWGSLALAGRWPLEAGLPALGLGTALAVLALGSVEFRRRRRVTYVTSRRIVLRGGVGRLTEVAHPLDRVVGVRAAQPPLGQVFGFATLVVGLEAKGRSKGAPSPAERLEGVPDWEVVKHRLEAALEERRLSPKERARRAEERRLRESMKALAGWSAQAPRA